MKIPSQYLPVMPYIIVSNAKGFADFVKTVFGATDQFVAPGENERDIMHGELKINDAVIMYASATATWETKACGMFIYVEDVDKVYNAALEHGAKNLMTPEKKDYGYTAGFSDNWGNQWWIVEGD